MEQKNMFGSEAGTGNQHDGQARRPEKQENRSEDRQKNASGDPVEKKEGVKYYLWTAPGGRVFHVEHMHNAYQPLCGSVLKKPKNTPVEHWYFRTPHKPIGMIFCEKCQKQRGVFDLPHKQDRLIPE